jgi:uncharacterized protein (TIGR00725 family)
MKIKIGVMGSAEEMPDVCAKAEALGRAIAARDAILLTGATTGVVYATGKAARDAAATHVGISPAHNAEEHVERYELPLDACDAIIYTGFGLKGRNVVLVRSCDVVIFISGSIGSLNEFTIAYDEGKVIGCLTGTGGVADEIQRLTEVFTKQTKAQICYADDPVELLNRCFTALQNREGRERMKSQDPLR